MMTGHRNVGQKETFAGGNRIDPRKHAFHGGRLIHSETGIHIAADVTRILQRIESAIFDHRFHSQIHEAAGMKQRSPVADLTQLLRNRHARRGRIVVRRRSKRRILRTQHRKQSANAFRIYGIGIVKNQRLRSEPRQIRSGIFGSSIQAQIPGCRGFQQNEHHVPAGGCTAVLRDVSRYPWPEGNGLVLQSAASGRSGIRRKTSRNERTKCIAMHSDRLHLRQGQRANRHNRNARQSRMRSDESQRLNSRKKKRKTCSSSKDQNDGSQVDRSEVVGDGIPQRASGRPQHWQRQRRREHACHRNIDRHVHHEQRRT